MILEIATVVAPVMIIIALGYGWARFNFPFDNDTVGSLVLRVGVPCLIFSSLTSADIELGQIGQILLAAILVVALSTLIGVVVLKAMRLPLHTYLMVAMSGNSGNMGLPVALMAFGPIGLPPAIAYFLVVTIVQNTAGMMINAGKANLGGLLRQPVIWASAITLLALLLGPPIPVWLERTTDLLGGIVIPLMLLLLGASLADFQVRDLGLSLAMAALRFVVGAVAALPVIYILGLEGVDAGVVFIIAVMPVPVMHFLLAERFGRSPEKVAGIIVVSTLVTLAALPAIVWVGLRIAGTA